MDQQSLDDHEGSGFGNGGREDTEWTILQEILWASLAYSCNDGIERDCHRRQHSSLLV